MHGPQQALTPEPWTPNPGTRDPGPWPWFLDLEPCSLDPGPLMPGFQTPDPSPVVTHPPRRCLVLGSAGTWADGPVDPSGLGSRRRESSSFPPRRQTWWEPSLHLHQHNETRRDKYVWLAGHVTGVFKKKKKGKLSHRGRSWRRAAAAWRSALPSARRSACRWPSGAAAGCRAWLPPAGRSGSPRRWSRKWTLGGKAGEGRSHNKS